MNELTYENDEGNVFTSDSYINPFKKISFNQLKNNNYNFFYENFEIINGSLPVNDLSGVFNNGNWDYLNSYDVNYYIFLSKFNINKIPVLTWDEIIFTKHDDWRNKWTFIGGRPPMVVMESDQEM